MGLDIAGVGAVANLAQDLVDKLFPDKVAQAKQREEYLLKAQELDNQLAQAQISVNQAEAASSSLFVAGWRPFIGWTCGAAFAYHLIVQPLIAFIAAAAGYNFALPIFDTETLNTALMGLLGLGTLRTVEKIRGVN